MRLNFENPMARATSAVCGTALPCLGSGELIMGLPLLCLPSRCVVSTVSHLLFHTRLASSLLTFHSHLFLQLNYISERRLHSYTSAVRVTRLWCHSSCGNDPYSVSHRYQRSKDLDTGCESLGTIFEADLLTFWYTDLPWNVHLPVSRRLIPSEHYR
jgi:hypothetical protein